MFKPLNVDLKAKEVLEPVLEPVLEVYKRAKKV